MTVGQLIDWLKENECDKETVLGISEGARYGPLVVFKVSGKNEIILTLGE